MVGLFQNNMMLRRRSMMAEDGKIVIADDTKYGVAEANAPVVEIMYKKGWCKNEHYVTQGECNAITPSMIGNAFQDTTAIEHFDELKYFGSLNVLPAYIFRRCKELKRVTIPSGCKALNNYIFSECYALETVNTQGNDFYATTTLNHAFHNCQKLKKLDVSNWKLSRCRDMGYMFYGCSGLTTLDVTGFDTKAVTNMGYMFNGCSSLTTLDVTGFDTKAVTNMGYMFNGCSGLTTLDVTNFDTKAVTNMYSMFYGCSGLTTLDVTNFDTKAVTDMGYMFYGCSGLTTLDVTGFDTKAVTNMNGMFTGCNSLKSLNLGNWDTTNFSYVCRYPIDRFPDCKSLTQLNLKNWDTTNFADQLNLIITSGMEEVTLGEGFGKSKIGIYINAAGNTKWVSTSLVTSLLALYDRKTNGLSDCTIKLSSVLYAALGDDNIATLQTRGYNVTT